MADIDIIEDRKVMQPFFFGDNLKEGLFVFFIIDFALGLSKQDPMKGRQDALCGQIAQRIADDGGRRLFFTGLQKENGAFQLLARRPQTGVRRHGKDIDAASEQMAFRAAGTLQHFIAVQIRFQRFFYMNVLIIP